MENVALHLHTVKVCSFTAMNIKTTGNALSGKSDKMLEYLSEIRTIIEEDE